MSRCFTEEQIINIFATALLYKNGYEDSNPEVGMGTSKLRMLIDLEKEMGIKLTEKQQNEVLKKANNENTRYYE